MNEKEIKKFVLSDTLMSILNIITTILLIILTIFFTFHWKKVQHHLKIYWYSNLDIIPVLVIISWFIIVIFEIVRVHDNLQMEKANDNLQMEKANDN